MSRGIIVHVKEEFIRNQQVVIWETLDGVMVNGCRVCPPLVDQGSPDLVILRLRSGCLLDSDSSVRICWKVTMRVEEIALNIG